MPAKKIVLSKNPELMTILKHSYFHAQGFTLIEVEDGQTGFEAVEAEAPSLAIFDVNQMGDQALQCCQKIKQDPLLRNTPIVIVLPDTRPNSLERACLEAGSDAMVNSPLSREKVVESAFEVLGISKRLQKRFSVNLPLTLMDAKQKEHRALCVNINQGGLFVATEQLSPVDSKLKLYCHFPAGNDTVFTLTRVAWVNHPEWLKKDSLPHGMGLEFIDSDELFRDELEKFIKTLSDENALK
jgi:CheY-like chemotaxis protein